MRLALFAATLAMAAAAALPTPVPAASLGTCSASAPEIDIGSASSVMAGYDPLKGLPSHQTVPVTVNWAISGLGKNGTATVTVNLSAPTGTLIDPTTGTPLAYSVYYGTYSSGVLFANGLNATGHYTTTLTKSGNGHDTFQIDALIGPSQGVKVSKTPLSYTDATLQFQCTVS
jgi:hypothetical protein